jgi:hypothetical protein
MPIIQSLNKSSDIQGHICVIGTGPGAAFVAVELAKKKFDVIVLETGGEFSKLNNSIDLIGSKCNTNPQNRGFAKEFGGLSNYWAGRTVPLEDFDFNNILGRNNPKWPISYNELVPFYKKASEIMKIPFEKIWPKKIQKKINSVFLKINNLSSYLSTKYFYWNTPPFNTKKYLKNYAAKHKNLKVYIGIHARYFMQNKSGKISHLKAANLLDLSEVKIKCKCFVLAAGGLENARILLNSKKQNPKYSGDYSEVIGKGLVTHPKANIGILTLASRVSINDPLFTDCLIQDGKYRLGLGLITKKSQLNNYVQFSPIMEYKFNRLFEKANNSIFFNNTFLDRSRFIKALIPTLGLKLYESFNQLIKAQPKSKSFIIRGFFDQTPEKQNQVFLSNKKDLIGDRKICIKWDVSKNDKKKIRNFILKLAKIFKENNLGEINSNINNIWKSIEIHSHFIGTTKMGTNSFNSVVDKNCKIHKIDNLYVSGSSVFSNGGYANPFLTIAAISVRLGNHLSFKYKKNN